MLIQPYNAHMYLLKLMEKLYMIEGDIDGLTMPGTKQKKKISTSKLIGKWFDK